MVSGGGLAPRGVSEGEEWATRKNAHGTREPHERDTRVDTKCERKDEIKTLNETLVQYTYVCCTMYKVLSQYIALQEVRCTST